MRMRCRRMGLGRTALDHQRTDNSPEQWGPAGRRKVSVARSPQYGRASGRIDRSLGVREAALALLPLPQGS